MLEFFTKLLTPVFISIGLINPVPTITEQPQPIIQQEVVQEETTPEIEITETDSVEEDIIDAQEAVIEKTEDNSNAIQQSAEIIQGQPKAEVVIENVSVSRPVESTEVLNQEEIQVLISAFTSTENNQNEQQIETETGEAVCGLAEQEVFEFNKPTENLCINGTPSEITIYQGESYRWSCETEDDRDRCKASRKINGQCGDIANTGAILKEGFDRSILCNQGELVNPREINGELEYFCNGTIESAVNARCSVYVEVDGVCGNSIGTCQQGRADNIRSSGDKERWQCIGINGGQARDCSAVKPRQTTTTPSYQNTNSYCRGWYCGVSA